MRSEETPSCLSIVMLVWEDTSFNPVAIWGLVMIDVADGCGKRNMSACATCLAVASLPVAVVVLSIQDMPKIPTVVLLAFLTAFPPLMR